MKSNDYLLSEDDKEQIRVEADRLLKESGAYGIFPTPMKKLLAQAKLRVNYLDELVRCTEDAPNSVKRALSKLQGFLHRADRKIYVDRAMGTTRRKFIAVHEIAHDWLPDQRHLFEILEDSEFELDSETRDLFERSANCFASDVLFQLDNFDKDVRSLEFGIGAPVKTLSKRYGTSIYSTLRRYTHSCGAPVALLVCEQPNSNGELAVRRFIPSREFIEEFGEIGWPETLDKNSWFARNRPGKIFMLPTPWRLDHGDKQGPNTMCLVEACDSSKQIFYFIYPMSLQFSGRRTLTNRFN